MSNEKKSIKEWAADDRPREKMMQKGKMALSDAELIAILIGSGNSKQSAVELSRSILDSVGNSLVALSNLSLEELMRHKGIGEAKAITIMAALELGKRRRAADATESDILGDSRNAYERFLPLIDDMKQEHLMVMYLNQKSVILKMECASVGGITRTVADPKIIFRTAINLGATAIVIAHNHPSGISDPSPEDKKLTQKFLAVADLLDMQLVDHIIIGEGNYFSFYDHKLLDLWKVQP